MAARKKPAMTAANVCGDHGERLASLETGLHAHVDNDARAFDELREMIRCTNEAVAKCNETTSGLRTDFANHKSFVGGIIFAVSAVWALIAGIAKFWPFH